MNTIDVGSALDDAHWSGYQKLLVFATAMTIILDGLDNQLLNAAVPALMREWSLPRPAFVPVQTSGMVGMMVGGAIGGLIGDRFGRRVALLARPRVIEEIAANGLRLTSFEGFEKRIASNQLTLSDDPSILGDTGVVLVTVKSADTAGIADIIAKHAPADAVIVSLQNGVGNVAVLRQRLPGRRVLAGMVPAQTESFVNKADQQ